MIHIALEGRCFVLSANQFVTKNAYTGELANHPEIERLPDTVCRGGSMIVSPMGEVLIGPVWDRREIIDCTIDLDDVQRAKMDFDPIGHYARSDVFHFEIKGR